MTAAASPAPVRRLVVNCDDFGCALCANAGVEEALTAGIATSATVMVPCPWAYDAVRRAMEHPRWAIGVHLTHTAEWPRYRWRPLLAHDRVPGLYGPDGFMWSSTRDVHQHATAEEALAEGAAQIEQAMAWGLKPTHIDSHMGVMQLDPRFYEVYLTLAERYRLPLRMAGPRQLAAAVPTAPWAADVRRRALARGLCFTDDLQAGPSHGELRDAQQGLVAQLDSLGPGTAEMLFHPCEDGPDLAAMIPSGGRDRVRDLRLLTDPALPRALEARGIHLVSYRDLPPATA